MSKEQVSSEYLQEDISGQLVAAASVILVITTILLALRLYVRSLPNVKSGLEDFLLLPAYILSMGASTIGLLAVTKRGAGRHIEAVMLEDPKSVDLRSALLFSLSWLTIYSNCFSRVSILVLLFKIFTPGVTRTCTLLLTIYMVLFAISQSIAVVLECRPIAKLWHPKLEGSCINMFLFFKMNGILTIVGDVAIMVLPAHMVWNLHASMARRIGIALVFLSGRGDVKLISWIIVESGMYMSAACMIRLRPLPRKLREWFGQFRAAHSSSGSGKRSKNALEVGKGHELKHYVKQGHIPLTSIDQDLNQARLITEQTAQETR
ncbi:integral membrane protein [Aspergillus steynii IBT 23096]|uniref:Integral membrane protein n=1 Tax=Aspergillus steynii IBT 23096 TaxID=1392250 RepID=A0A2I2GRV8_9EURO|nr:uncharacterized protein P170DRAFT_422130 [Aspergillus steynii IBT 23096]PLB55593.1 integral membrane protein [Aspergillus steynii IBT 23096]